MAGELEYSKTAGSNAAINGIAILGTSSMKYGNDAIQQLMADRANAITRIVDKAAGTYTALSADFNQMWRATGAATFNLTAAATLTSGWALWVKADGGAITIDPNSAELINGASTLVVRDRSSAFIVCTGTGFQAVVFDDPGVKSLEGGTVTNVATKDIVLTSYIAAGYSSFELDILASRPVTDVVTLQMHVSNNGGSSFFASQYQFSGQSNGNSANNIGNSTNSPSILIIGNQGNVAGEFTNLWARFDVSQNFVMEMSGISTTATPDILRFACSGQIGQTGVNALRITYSAGNISTLTHVLRGKRSS